MAFLLLTADIWEVGKSFCLNFLHLFVMIPPKMLSKLGIRYSDKCRTAHTS